VVEKGDGKGSKKKEGAGDDGRRHIHMWKLYENKKIYLENHKMSRQGSKNKTETATQKQLDTIKRGG